MATVVDLLLSGQKTLGTSGIEDAQLESQILLCHVLGVDLSVLLQQLRDEVSPNEQRQFESYLK